IDVVERGGDEQLLCVTAHHAVLDGWSVSLLLQELAAAELAFAAGAPPALPAVATQLGDLARWEAEALAGGRFAGALAALGAELAGVPRLALPARRPAPGEVPARATVRLPAALCRGVEELARRAGTTPFVVLAGALAVLLGRHEGQLDFGLGTVLANRDLGDTTG